VAALIGAEARDLVFTSGATEATISPSRVAQMYRPHGDHLITGVTEHRAVLEPPHLERAGYRVTYLPVDRFGGRGGAGRGGDWRADVLVSLMAANNEVARCIRSRRSARLQAPRRAVPHRRVQQAGKLPIDVEEMASG